jgi:hypothetical protein
MKIEARVSNFLNMFYLLDHLQGWIKLASMKLVT